MHLLRAALMMICCISVSAFAVAKTERVTAIKPDGSIVLSASGNAAFSDILLPDARRAEAWLAEHVLQQNIDVEMGETDRYGRTMIRSSVEEQMLRDGVAMYYASEEDIPPRWAAAEAAARHAGRGLWEAKDTVLTPYNVAQHQGSFAVVEGTITRTYDSKPATYLNFGDDWHSDFSVTVPGKARRSMKDILARLKPGTKVLVRGYVYEENGPMIKLMKADNLEIR